MLFNDLVKWNDTTVAVSIRARGFPAPSRMMLNSPTLGTESPVKS